MFYHNDEFSTIWKKEPWAHARNLIVANAHELHDVNTTVHTLLATYHWRMRRALSNPSIFSLTNLSTYALHTFLLHWIIMLTTSKHSTLNKGWHVSMSLDVVGVHACCMTVSVLASGKFSKYVLFYSYSIVFSFLIIISSISLCSLLLFVSRAHVIHIFPLSCDTIMILEHHMLLGSIINRLHVHCTFFIRSVNITLSTWWLCCYIIKW